MLKGSEERSAETKDRSLLFTDKTERFKDPTVTETTLARQKTNKVSERPKRFWPLKPKDKDMNPKAFICHASEDKQRFVAKFAEKLRQNGVDAWLDQWEILPGDSLVDKVFEEGIKTANVFIIILSSKSVIKPWVREELNAGFVKRLGKLCKIIPVVIEDCEIPECLKSTLWERIKNLDNYDEELNRIVKAIFENREKPKLGTPPKYLKTPVETLPGLTETDTLIFNYACEETIKNNAYIISTEDLKKRIADLEIPFEEIKESLEILDSKGFIQGTKAIGHGIARIQIRISAFEEFLKIRFSDYPETQKNICLKILNEGITENWQLAESLDVPKRIADHVLELLEYRGLAKIVKAIDGTIKVLYCSPELKRAFK